MNLSRAARVKQQIMGRQLDALGATGYRVTLTRERSDGSGVIGWNYTRGADGVEVPLTADELKARVADLSRQNARGWNVFITPLDERFHYLVVDDLKGADGLTALKERGYRPATVAESSPGNLQAVVKVRKEDEAERDAANAWVRQVNREIGDPRFAGAVHGFRLVGFANRKEKHEREGQFPFVKLLEAGGAVDDRVRGELQTVEAPRRREHVVTVEIGPAPDAARKAWREEQRRVEGLAQRRGWVIDRSAVDFRVARALLEREFRGEDVARALVAESPGVRERHPAVGEYAARTVQRAGERVPAPSPG